MYAINDSIRVIKECRLCESTNLDLFIDFGHVPLGNNLQITEQKAKAVDKYKLDVMRCLQCGHFQLGHAVNPNLLYATNYTYLSGIGSRKIILEQSLKSPSLKNFPKNSTLIWNQNLFQKSFNIGPIPLSMRSKLARPWSNQFRLILMLSKMGIGMRE